MYQAMAALEDKTPHLFIAEYSVIWHGASLWLVWVSCPGCVASQLLAHSWPIHWGGTERETEAALTLCKNC